MRNNILNITDTYLKKFGNESISQDFYKRLKQAKEEAANNGFINKYQQYMEEICVVQEFKGMKENIAEKLGDQLFNNWRKWEAENATNDTN